VLIRPVRVRRWLGGLAAAIVVIGALGVACGLVLHEPMPAGEPGPAADALARKLEAWSNPNAWAETRVVQWTFRGVHHHLWDRDRGWVRTRHGDRVTWLRIADRTGVVEQDGVRVGHERARRSLESAYARWVNDSFWLNPLVKLFDPGTRRELVGGDDGGLLVIYESGGVTPGDAYLWEVGADGAPVAWRMWVKIIPIGGLRTTWEDWVELSTGARIATRHALTQLPVGALELTDVEGATSWRALGFETDPFAPLISDESTR
jgi:hypothetical protein